MRPAEQSVTRWLKARGDGDSRAPEGPLVYQELRFFAGVTTGQTAHVLGFSERMVMRRLFFARMWLYRELQESAARGC
jgi:hypothetical protein